MALFMKKTNTGTHAPLYTLSAEKTVLVVGLGNVGSKYNGTRHNIGFDAVDTFAKHNDFPKWELKKSLKAEVSVNQIIDNRVILVKPTTLMNNSGEAMQAVQKFYKLKNTHTVVVHDEIDVSFGSIRNRTGGSAAGHNGIKSLIDLCGDDFGRVRVGIGPVPAKKDSADFVLAKFSKDEQKNIPALLNEVSVIISEYLATGKLPTDTRKVIE